MFDGSKTGGFSLVEVLVSVLVLAIGVIGAAGVQLTTMRIAREAAYHALALDLAVEIADAIRAGARRLPEQAGGRSFWEFDYRPMASDETGAASSRSCYLEVCDAAEYAAFERQDWKQRLATLFPDGRMLVCRDAIVWSEAKGAPEWDCNGATAGAPLAIKLGWQAGSRNADAPVVAMTVNPPPQ
jgi:type IV pilus assembly protein PilV